jgi:hypothetical protein
MPKQSAKRRRPLSPETLTKLRENARKAREAYRARPKAKGGPKRRAQVAQIIAAVKDWRGETIRVGDTVICPGQRGEALFLTEGVVTDIRRRIRGSRAFTVFDVLQRPATADGTAKHVSVWTGWITKVAPVKNREVTEKSAQPLQEWTEDEWSHGAFSREHLISNPNYEVAAVRVYEAYRDYCEQNRKPASRRNSLTSWLVRELRIRRRHSQNRDYYVGVRLKGS